MGEERSDAVVNDDILVRPEQPHDIAAIRKLYELAFGGSDEARLVDAVLEALQSFSAARSQ